MAKETISIKPPCSFDVEQGELVIGTEVLRMTARQAMVLAGHLDVFADNTVRSQQRKGQRNQTRIRLASKGEPPPTPIPFAGRRSFT
jgi:hypothetical protein